MYQKILGVLFVLCVSLSFASAQVNAGLGAIAGVVTDSTKAAIPGAHVTLSNPSIGLTQETTTNGAGEYRFTALTVMGGYKLQVKASGFNGFALDNLTTSVGTVVTQNVALTVGATDTVVEVQAGSVEQAQTDTSSLSQLIDSTVWKNSPLENRSQNDFVALVAGAAPDSGGTQRGLAVNGTRTGAGNFLVDGFDNNDQGQGGSGVTYGTGGAVTTISPDAIQEYRVITHIPPAEYGRAGGFATDTVLKSGTRQWHGSLFAYNRIQALAANDFFSTRNGLRDHLVRNQFGGSIGGPVYKDKTFFFATVEMHRLRQSAPITGVGTTQAFIDFVNSGRFKNFMEGTAENTAFSVAESNGNTAYQQGVCPINGAGTCPGLLSSSATLGPVFKKLLAAEPGAFPLATTNLTHIAQGLYTSGAGTGTSDVYFPVPVYGTVTGPQSNNTNQYRGSLKLDHKLSEKDQLSFTYLADFENNYSNNAGGDSTFGPPQAQIGGSQNFGASWNRSFTPTLLNQFKAAYLRHVSNFEAPGTDGVPSLWTADSLTAGFGASAGLPQYFTDNQFSYEDSLTKTIARHTFKGGFRYVRTRNGSSFFNDVKGTLAPWSVEGLLTDSQSDEAIDNFFFGAPTYGGLYYASASVDPSMKTLPDVYRGYRANEFAAYFQDDFKLSSRLTINAGLRWEYFGPPHNFKAGYDSNVYFGTFGPATPNGNPFLPVNAPIIGAIQGAKFIQKDSNIWNKDKNNFAPRFGFAYDALGTGKLVLRGGFGIGFDRLYNNVYENLRFNAPRFADNTIGYGAGSAVVASLTDFPGLYNSPFTGNLLLLNSGGKPVPRHIDQRLVTAYYEQAHFGVQSQIAKGYVLEVNYISTFGRKLVGLNDVNNYDGRTACTSSSSSSQKARCKAAGYTTFTSARPNLTFNGDNFRSNGFSSNYNAGQVSLRKGYSNGLQLMANYTYSKAMDQVSDVFKQKNGSTGPLDVLNPGYDYGPADFDVRHNVVITANYELQVKNKKNLLTGGWAVAPILKMHSGTPFSVYSGSSSYDPNKDGRTGHDRVVYVGSGSVRDAISHQGSPAGDSNGNGGYLKQGVFAQYACPTTVNAGLWCNPPASRNMLNGPAFYNVDLGVLKHFYFGERNSVSFEANFFNLFNHTNFKNPTADVISANYGKSTDDYGPRVTQLSLRYDF